MGRARNISWKAPQAMAAEDYSLPPDDLTGLTDAELAETLEETVSAFDQLSQQTAISNDDLATMRQLRDGAHRVRQEQASRREAAEQAAAEIDQLAAEIRGGDDNDDGTDGDGDGDGEAGAEDGGDGDAAAADPEPQQVSASTAVVPRQTLDLSSVRRRQPRVPLRPEAKPGIEITASVDVPGLVPGQSMQFEQIAQAINSRANALRTAGGGTGLVMSYKYPVPDDLVVTDWSTPNIGSEVIIRASDQHRLPQQDLVASGGWCAPSETLYELIDISCPDMLWDVPEVQLARGGIRYFLTPPLDVANMTWIHTEADDISGAEKPCFKIPCPDPIERRCDAVGVCIESGILTQRFFPELVNWYVRNAMVALEIRIRQALWEQLIDPANAMTTHVTMPPTFGALSAVYAAVGLQAADLIERYSLCDRISLEVVFPWWARNLFLADIARQNGQNVCDLSPSCIQDVFSTLGVRVQFARGLSPAVPDDIGGLTPATEWPSELQFVIYPAGAVQMGRGESVDLGVIYDSNRFVTNDFTAAFVESCYALIQRQEARAVTIPVCASGETGAQTLLTCPAGGSPGESPSSP